MLFLMALALACSAPASQPGVGEQQPVAVLTIQGAITPVTARYVERALGEAEEAGATAVVLRLDTPGGLDSAMRDIIQRILNAQVPVVAYVAPTGARAASAGAFITMSAHVAAMAPNTAIGAAHPVSIGGSGEQPSDPSIAKATNDAAAYMRSLAQERGRNAEVAERMVRESISLTEREALERNLIELIATNEDALLERLHGRAVTLVNGPVELRTAGAPRLALPMNAFERFLAAITEPNIAYLLLSIAFLALWAELANPGAILPGIVGVLALLLALFGLGNLPFNYAGLLLIGFAFLLFLAEVWVTSHGMLAIGGVISLLLGSLMLMSGNPAYFTVSPWLIGMVVVSFTGFFVFMVVAVIRGHRRPVATGREALVGMLGTARTELAPEGSVYVAGEIWTARTEEPPIPVGATVRVTSVDGLRLWVRQVEEPLMLREQGRLPSPATPSLPEPPEEQERTSS
jgi:membrane-bound serine protease (ClpP class)